MTNNCNEFCAVCPHDRIQQLFDLQKTFQGRVHGVELPQSLPERLPMQITALIAELGEVLKENEHWKDWKQNPRGINREDLKGEIVDLWHFFININLYCGFDVEEIYQAFLEKNKINHVRQDTGY